MNDKHEKLALLIDRIDGLVHALKLPLTTNLHLKGIRANLPKILTELKTTFVDITGEDPWKV